MKITPRRLLAAAATVALLSLTGCSDDATPAPTPTDEPTVTDTNNPDDSTDGPDGDSGEDTNVPVPTISADPETGKFDWCNPEEQSAFTGDAATKFGPEKVMSAYCTFVDLEMEHQFNDTLLRQSDGFTTQDFDVVRQYLSQSTREDFDADVAALIAGNATDAQINDIRGLVAFDFTDASWELEEPAVFNQRFSDADIWIDDKTGNPRLGMEFSIGADVAMVAKANAKKRVAFPYDRTVTLWLVPGRKGGERDWYIDGYTSTVKAATPVPREKLIK